MDPGSNFFSFLLINDHDLNVLGHNLEHTTIPPPMPGGNLHDQAVVVQEQLGCQKWYYLRLSYTRVSISLYALLPNDRTQMAFLHQY